jgi:hypothetical protein
MHTQLDFVTNSLMFPTALADQFWWLRLAVSNASITVLYLCPSGRVSLCHLGEGVTRQPR